MDISNKFLVFLLVVAILVTIVGTWYSIDKISRFASLTGYQVTEGNVSVNITQRAEINVTQPNCAFGSGYVTAPAAYAELHPNCTDTDVQDNWTNTTAYAPDCMIVRNDGNRKVWVNVSSGKNPATMIGGTSPNVTAWSENKETDSCATGGIVNKVDYPGVEMNTTNRTMCSCLWPNNATDEMYIGCYLKIPDDTSGAKTDTWTFSATVSGTVPDCGSD